MRIVQDLCASRAQHERRLFVSVWLKSSQQHNAAKRNGLYSNLYFVPPQGRESSFVVGTVFRIASRNLYTAAAGYIILITGRRHFSLTKQNLRIF
jgi:hypothetical protein